MYAYKVRKNEIKCSILDQSHLIRMKFSNSIHYVFENCQFDHLYIIHLLNQPFNSVYIITILFLLTASLRKTIEEEKEGRNNNSTSSESCVQIRLYRWAVIRIIANTKQCNIFFVLAFIFWFVFLRIRQSCYLWFESSLFLLLI